MIGIFGLLLVAMVLVVKFCKKTLKLVLSILIILATLYCVIISKYAPIVKINQNDNNNNIDENYQKYSKIIDNVKIELNIPNEWKYKEMPKNEDNDFYKYALKLYKNSENNMQCYIFIIINLEFVVQEEHQKI